jgi:hypothetical protein
MSHRTAAWLAWLLCAGCFALIGLALLLDFLTGEVPLRPGWRISRFLVRNTWPGSRCVHGSRA